MVGYPGFSGHGLEKLQETVRDWGPGVSPSMGSHRVQHVLATEQHQQKALAVGTVSVTSVSTTTVRTGNVPSPPKVRESFPVCLCPMPLCLTADPPAVAAGVPAGRFAGSSVS